MIIRDIVFSTTPPVMHNVLWIKAGDNNINTLYVYDGRWRKIGTSSGGGTSDYNDLENKPKINNVVLEGNLSLEDLGIIIPDLESYVTTEALNTALEDYAKKTDIPSIEGLLSKEEAQETYQPKGDYALKGDIPNISGLASKEELSQAISDQSFKTINGQEITGEGNIEIEGGSITIDKVLDEDSENPVANSTLTPILNRLNEKVFPLTLSVTGGSTYEKGTTQTVTVRWTVKEGDSTVTPDTVTVNDEAVDLSTTSKVFSGVTQNTTYTVKVVKNGIEKSGSTSANFVNASYYGAVEADYSPTEETIKTLTKRVAGSRSLTANFDLTNQKSCYAYPKAFGALTSIKDANFDYLSSYTRSELTVNEETYYVYVLSDPTTITNFKQVYA